MAYDAITIQLEGDAAENGQPRLTDFLEELQAIRAALRRTETLVTGEDEPAVVYRVADLSHKSPYTVRLIGVPSAPRHATVPRRVIRRFTTTLRMVRRNRIPHDFDLATAEIYKKVAEPLNKKMASVRVTDEQEKKHAVIDRELPAQIERIIGADQYERGSVMGRMDTLQAHNPKQSWFYIYPRIGPEKIRCTFGSRLRDKVFAVAGQYVRVDGYAIYKPDEKYPHAMRVTDIEPMRGAARIAELHGIAPDAAGGIPSEEFVRKIRNGW